MEKELFAKDQEKASALSAKAQLEIDLKAKTEEIKRLITVCNCALNSVPFIGIQCLCFFSCVLLCFTVYSRLHFCIGEQQTEHRLVFILLLEAL